MAPPDRLEFMMVRYPDGQTVVEIFDPGGDRWLRLPGNVLTALQHILGRELIDLVHGVLDGLPATSHAVSFWAERTARADRLTEPEFVNRLKQQTPKLARRFLAIGDASSRPPTDVHLSVENLRDCVALGLHHWRRRPLAEFQCSVCLGMADDLMPPPQVFEAHLSELILADPWRALAGRWLQPDPENDQASKMRLVLDADALSHPSRDEESALRYLSRRVPKHTILLRLAGSRVAPPLDDVPEVEVSVTVDRSGRRHLTGTLRDDRLEPRNFALGTEAELRGIAGYLGSGGGGMHRARLVGLRRDFEAMIVTTDQHLLAARGTAGIPAAIVTPRTAMISFGIGARHRGRVPVNSFLGLTREQFYTARTLCLAPEIVAYLQAASQEHGERYRATREAALCWSTRDRLAWMARAEDAIAFRFFYPGGEESADEALYHLDYLLLLATAVMEGLLRLAAEVHHVEGPTRPRFLMRLINALDAEHSPLAGFLRSQSVGAFRELVSRLRNPIAHAERWNEINSFEPPALLKRLIVPGDDATSIARSVVELDGDPQSWGVEGRRKQGSDLELYLEPFRFAVHLNAFMLAYAATFLSHLASGAGRGLSSQVSPWEHVNPPTDEETFEVVRLMSWPPLPRSVFEDEGTIHKPAS